ARNRRVVSVFRIRLQALRLAAGARNSPQALVAGAFGREDQGVALSRPLDAEDVAIIEGQAPGVAAMNGDDVNVAGQHQLAAADERQGLTVGRKGRVKVSVMPGGRRRQPGGGERLDRKQRERERRARRLLFDKGDLRAIGRPAEAADTGSRIEPAWWPA